MTLRDDGFLYCEPLYGPTGWTEEGTKLLEPWFLGEREGGLVRFAGVPISTAIDVCAHAALRELATTLAVTREVFGPDATVVGIHVGPERNDERLEFTRCELDVSARTRDDARAMVQAARMEGLHTALEASGDGMRLVTPL